MPIIRLIELDDFQGSHAASEELLVYLHRSSELLYENRPDEARRILDAIFELEGRERATDAILGATFFNLGMYSRALAVFKRLVSEDPKEAVLRLNLAIVYFKVGHTAKAKVELEEAVRLSPDYRKAHGYLGLAYQRLGDNARAGEAFKIAAAPHLISKMARFIEPGGKRRGSVDVFARQETMREDRSPTASSEDDQTGLQENANLQVPSKQVSLPTAALPPARDLETVACEPVTVDELISRTQLPEPLATRFLIGNSGYLLIEVSKKGFSRLDGLHFCSSEGLSYKPAKRRYRGQQSEAQFGEAESFIFEIDGDGRLGFHPRNAAFSAISINGEIAYVREQFLFAFDPEIGFENGRMPGGKELLVNLHGRGSIVLRTPAPPQSIEITPDRGVVIPMRGLVGWFGRLLPRHLQGGPFDPFLNAVEVSGEGVLLFCLS